MLRREAKALVEAQSAQRMFIAGGDERSAGKVVLNLGVMLARQDRHKEAAALFRTAGIRFARAKDATKSIFADIGLANALDYVDSLAALSHAHGLALPARLEVMPQCGHVFSDVFKCGDLAARAVEHPLSDRTVDRRDIDFGQAALRGVNRARRRPLRIFSAIVDAHCRLIVDGKTVLPQRRWGSAQELV